MNIDFISYSTGKNLILLEASYTSWDYVQNKSIHECHENLAY